MYPSVACTAQGQWLKGMFPALVLNYRYIDLNNIGSVSQVGDLGSAIWYGTSEDELSLVCELTL